MHGACLQPYRSAVRSSAAWVPHTHTKQRWVLLDVRTAAPVEQGEGARRRAVDRRAQRHARGRQALRERARPARPIPRELQCLIHPYAN